MRFGVVGHVEWAEFLRVPRVPLPGEIVHVGERWEQAGGGGAVASVQIARLAGGSGFFTALAGDAMGAAAREELAGYGVEVMAGERPAPSRRAIVHVDDAGERTITVVGDRMVASGSDPLPWDALVGYEAVYFTGGDAGALRAARAARVLVVTPRAADVLVEAGVDVDVLVHSASDAGEVPPASVRAGVVVATQGGRGGTWTRADGTSGRFPAAPLPGPVADAYGCGDSFAAGLTYGLGAGLGLDGALGLAARCGAAVLTGHGPYAAMLSSATPPEATG